MESSLEQARKIIDETDREMAALFEKRMDAVRTVAEYKKAHGMLIYDPVRENEVINKNSDYISDPDKREFYKRFLADTMKVSRGYQRKLLEKMRVAYSGTEGAFAFLAADKLFPTAEKRRIPISNGLTALSAPASAMCAFCRLKTARQAKSVR